MKTKGNENSISEHNTSHHITLGIKIRLSKWIMNELNGMDTYTIKMNWMNDDVIFISRWNETRETWQTRLWEQ